MTSQLIAAVNNKHDLDRAIAAWTRQAGIAAAKRQAVEAAGLVEMMQGFYRHERWTRGLGHEVAGRELRIEPAGSVGDDERRTAESREDEQEDAQMRIRAQRRLFHEDEEEREVRPDEAPTTGERDSDLHD